MATGDSLIRVANQLNPARPQKSAGFPQIEPGEVVDIILNSDHPSYKNPSDIGRAQVRRVLSQFNLKKEGLAWIPPIFNTVTDYPLIHELVLVVRAAGSTSGVQAGDLTDYWLGPINAWELNNYNPVPGSSYNAAANVTSKEGNKGKRYSSFAGNQPKLRTIVKDLSFGKTFIARPDIRKCVLYEGDKLLEGRWGQSIRIGSTVEDSNNNWSVRGDSGDPIILIRNGEPKKKLFENKDKPIIEDINSDPSSIYITSTQLINLDLASTNFKSYGLALRGSETCAWVSKYQPDLPNSYGGLDGKNKLSQIIANSGRIFLQAKDDSVFLNAKRSIGLSSKGSIHLDSDEPTIINSPKIHLGRESKEPGVLGQTLVGVLRELVVALMVADIATPTGPGLMGPGAQQSLGDISKKLENILCEVVRVE